MMAVHSGSSTDSAADKMAVVDSEQHLPLIHKNEGGESPNHDLCNTRAVVLESKKIWIIAGPAIFIKLAGFGTTLVTQVFVGHLGELELAAFNITNTAIVGLTFAILLGMGSAQQTMCGQAFGAKKYSQLGIYLQRAWIVLLMVATLLLPLFIWATPVLKLIGQSHEIAELSGKLAILLIPQHLGLALTLPLHTFFQSQIKNSVVAWISALTLLLHVPLTWVLIHRMKLGITGAVLAQGFSAWLSLLGNFLYVTCGACPLTWNGFSMAAFQDLWAFTKLSFSSGVMVCLEVWYGELMIPLAGLLENARLAVAALSICVNTTAIAGMVPLGFLTATSVRVANELGSGNGKGAKFAITVAASTSVAISLIFCYVMLLFRNNFGILFTSSPEIIREASKLVFLMVLTTLLSGFRLVLSGVAVGSGWQSAVGSVNLLCYYGVGIPVALLFGWVYKLHVWGIWAGMISGTLVQTLAIAFMTYGCDWEGEASKSAKEVNHWASAFTPTMADQELVSDVKIMKQHI